MEEGRAHETEFASQSGSCQRAASTPSAGESREEKKGLNSGAGCERARGHPGTNAGSEPGPSPPVPIEQPSGDHQKGMATSSRECYLQGSVPRVLYFYRSIIISLPRAGECARAACPSLILAPLLPRKAEEDVLQCRLTERMLLNAQHGHRRQSLCVAKQL